VQEQRVDAVRVRLDALDERPPVHVPEANGAVERAGNQVVVHAEKRAHIAGVGLLHLQHALSLL